MSWTQGGGSKGQTPWSAGSTRRRLAAGEAKRGGAGAGFTYRAPFGAPLGSMDSWEWAAASGAGSWVRGRRKRRRRRALAVVVVGDARARRYGASVSKRRGWAAPARHGEHHEQHGEARGAWRLCVQQQWRTAASVLVGNGATARGRAQGVRG